MPKTESGKYTGVTASDRSVPIALLFFLSMIVRAAFADDLDFQGGSPYDPMSWYDATTNSYRLPAPGDTVYTPPNLALSASGGTLNFTQGNFNGAVSLVSASLNAGANIGFYGTTNIAGASDVSAADFLGFFASATVNLSTLQADNIASNGGYVTVTNSTLEGTTYISAASATQGGPGGTFVFGAGANATAGQFASQAGGTLQFNDGSIGAANQLYVNGGTIAATSNASITIGLTGSPSDSGFFVEPGSTVALNDAANVTVAGFTVDSDSNSQSTVSFGTGSEIHAITISGSANPTGYISVTGGATVTFGPNSQVTADDHLTDDGGSSVIFEDGSTLTTPQLNITNNSTLTLNGHTTLNLQNIYLNNESLTFSGTQIGGAISGLISEIPLVTWNINATTLTINSGAVFIPETLYAEQASSVIVNGALTASANLSLGDSTFEAQNALVTTPQLNLSEGGSFTAVNSTINADEFGTSDDVSATVTNSSVTGTQSFFFGGYTEITAGSHVSTDSYLTFGAGAIVDASAVESTMNVTFEGATTIRNGSTVQAGTFLGFSGDATVDSSSLSGDNISAYQGGSLTVTNSTVNGTSYITAQQGQMEFQQGAQVTSQQFNAQEGGSIEFESGSTAAALQLYADNGTITSTDDSTVTIGNEDLDTNTWLTALAGSTIDLGANTSVNVSSIDIEESTAAFSGAVTSGSAYLENSTLTLQGGSFTTGQLAIDGTSKLNVTNTSVSAGTIGTSAQTVAQFSASTISGTGGYYFGGPTTIANGSIMKTSGDVTFGSQAQIDNSFVGSGQDVVFDGNSAVNGSNIQATGTVYFTSGAAVTSSVVTGNTISAVGNGTLSVASSTFKATSELNADQGETIDIGSGSTATTQQFSVTNGAAIQFDDGSTASGTQVYVNGGSFTSTDKASVTVGDNDLADNTYLKALNESNVQLGANSSVSVNLLDIENSAASFSGRVVSESSILNNAQLTSAQVVVTNSPVSTNAFYTQVLSVNGNSVVQGNVQQESDGMIDLNFSSLNQSTPLLTVVGDVHLASLPEVSVNGAPISPGQQFQAISYEGPSGTAFSSGQKMWEPAGNPSNPYTYVLFADSTQAPGLITAAGVYPNLSLSVGLTEQTKAQGFNLAGGTDAANFNSSITNLWNIPVAGSSLSLLDSGGASNQNTLDSAIAGLAQQEAQVHAQNTVIVYISTQGTYVSSIGQSELEIGTSGGTTDWLTGSQLASLFSGANWANVNKLFIVSACDSGGLWNSLSTLSHTALIASSQFNLNSQFDSVSGLPYFGSAVDMALSALAGNQSISFSLLANTIQTDLNSIYAALIAAGDAPEPLNDDGSAPPSDIPPDIFAASTGEFNLSLAAVPEPTPLSMCGVGAVALIGIMLRPQRASRRRRSML